MEPVRQNERKVAGLNPVIFVTGLVSLFTDLSSEMIVPVLPLFLTSVLQVQVGEVGVIEGIAESTASVLKLFSGWISDRMGRRKPLMLAGYGFSNLVKPLFALSTSWGQVLAIRFADRFGKGVRGAPRDALIADSTLPEERGKAFGFHRALDTVGAALGPLTAFAVLALFHENYRTVFWVSAVPGILAILLLAFCLKEKVHERLVNERSALPKIGFRSLGKRFIGFSLIATLFALGNSSDAFLILRAQDVGMAASHIPLAYFTFNVTYSVLAMPAGVLSDRIGRRTVLVLGYLIFAAIYLGFGVAKNSAWIWGLFVVYGLYYAATEGIQKAYVADLVPRGQRGMAMGTFNALTGLVTLPASILAGELWQAFGPMATFGASAICAVLAAILLVVFRI
ncbi:MFS transporter [Alicyclobacillus macrosporangiidus]|uniref:MFS transporter n=1 Tax=Alicyclobacillus macrosporangiidus TaxID=392015 RepID=UPI0026F1E091|nr:MFS transporter [Alicyclobacillus macrosporangiidus]